MSLQDKQQFLSQEIIEQGYDAGEFSNYISSIRGEDEVDLDAWTLEELKEVCEQFKAQQGQNQENQENQANQENQENQEYPEQQDISQQNYTPEEQPQNQENEEPQEPEQKPATKNEFPNAFLDPLTLTIKTEKMEPNEITDKTDLPYALSLIPHTMLPPHIF